MRLALEDDRLEMDIDDNGRGLPEQPERLFEPYVTDRPKGTGLGLPIVKKIIEEHDGTLELVPAPAFDGAARVGARARISLPRGAMPATLSAASIAGEAARSSRASEQARLAEKLRESIR